MTESVSESSATILSNSTVKKSIKILHVDDDQAFLKVAKQCLEMQDIFAVDTASSVNEASEKLKKKDYDAVVCDYQMPGKDGLELLKKLRAKGSTIPFIFFTGKGREEIAVKALNLGADGYFDKHGEPETVYGELAHGICSVVDRKTAEMKILEREEKLKAVFSSSPDAITVSDFHGKILDCNDATWKMFGLSSREEVIGKSSFDFIAEKDRQKAYENLKKTLEQGTTKNVEYTLLKKDGEEFCGELSASIIKDTLDNPVGFVGAIREITERKRSETEIKRLSSFPEENPNPVLEIDLTGKTTYLNPTVRKMLSPLHDSKLSDGLEQDLKIVIGEFNTHRIENFLREDIKIGDRQYEQAIYYVPESATLRIYMTDTTERSRAKKTLQESEEKYRRLVENLQEGVWTIDKDSFTTFVNSQMAKMLGYTVDEMLGKSLFAFMDELGIEIAKRLMERRAQGIREQHDFEFVKKDGSRIYATLETSPINDSNGNYIGALAGVMDITERKKAEEALRKSEEKFRNLFDNANDAMIYLDGSGRILEVNRRTVEIFGGTREELIGKQFTEIGIFSVKETPELMRNLASILVGNTANLNVTIKNKKGQQKDLECSASLLKSDESTSMVAVARDISERKKTEQALHASIDRYRSFIEVTGELGWTTNADGEAVEDLPSLRKFTGQTYDEVKGWGWSKALHPDDLEGATQTWKEATRTKSKYETEYRLRRHDGIYRYFLARGVPVFAEDGSIREWVGTCIDITERKKAEQKLKESENRFRLVFEGATDGILAADAKTGKFVFANLRICEITGYSEKELLRLRVEDIHPKKDLAYVADTFTKQLQRKIEIGRDMPVLRKDGDVVYCDICAYPLEVEERKLLVGLFRDVTDRKNAERVIIESQQKFEALFRDNPEAAVYLDLDFKILDVNPRFCELFGYSAKEIEGKYINEVVTPEDMIEEAERLDKDVKKGYASRDTFRKRKDGSLVHVSISAAPINIEGKLLSYIGVYKDITDLKNAEKRLRETNKRLEATNEKLHVVGGLTRHDVRNKLTAVTGNAYLLRRKLTEDPKALEQLNDMETAVRLVERIFEFARIYEKLGVEQLANLDVGEAVAGVVSLFSDLKGVKIVNECRGLTVLADSLLSQLFYNLVDNSLKYGEKIRQIKIHYNTLNADQLELVYEDDGVGIPDSMRSNLFKEGFTSGKGTGYGLFMIKRISEVYGWAIQETGTSGKGAQFTITIPKTNSDKKENYHIV